MKHLRLLCVLCGIFSGPALAAEIVRATAVTRVVIKETCTLEKGNADKWHHMLSKASMGEYQDYLTKRYRLAQQEYLQCLRRGKQEPLQQNS